MSSSLWHIPSGPVLFTPSFSGMLFKAEACSAYLSVTSVLQPCGRAEDPKRRNGSVFNLRYRLRSRHQQRSDLFLKIVFTITSSGRHLESLSHFYDAARELIRNSSLHPKDVTRDDLVVVPGTKTVTISNREFSVPNVEAAILTMLVQNAGVVVENDELCKTIRAASRCRVEWLRERRESLLFGHISRLRKALGIFQGRVVRVRGQGYMYVDQPSVKNPGALQF
jgi:DNA-binding response OmpR family regulator